MPLYICISVRNANFHTCRSKSKLVYVVLTEFLHSLTSSQFQNRILPNPFNNGIDYGTIELILQSSK